MAPMYTGPLVNCISPKYVGNRSTPKGFVSGTNSFELPPLNRGTNKVNVSDKP